jgi:CheY-like chemotaxis protein
MVIESDPDVLEFMDEPDETEVDPIKNLLPWRVLVVDDEVDIHHITNITLNKRTILGRSLNIVHAYSAKEAREILKESSEFAVILLDVVMETEDAGLLLATYIRHVQKNARTHIILRTGHPVSISESDAEHKYGCNYYEQKNNITANRLIMMLERGMEDYLSKSAAE